MTQQDMAVKVTDSTESVLDVLHKGRATPGHIVEETSLSRQTVHSQLNQLLAGEHVRYVHEATGLYELVNDPRDDVDQEDGSDVEELRARIDELEARIESATEWAEAAVEALERVDGEDAEKNARATVAALEGDDG